MSLFYFNFVTVALLYSFSYISYNVYIYTHYFFLLFIIIFFSYFSFTSIVIEIYYYLLFCFNKLLEHKPPFIPSRVRVFYIGDSGERADIVHVKNHNRFFSLEGRRRLWSNLLFYFYFIILFCNVTELLTIITEVPGNTVGSCVILP